MSRPPQVHLETALNNIGAALRGEGVTMPYSVAVGIDGDLEDAIVQAARLSKFAFAMADAMDAVEGLLANWPTTDVVGLYEPSGQPVLMTDAALRKAADALKRYQEIGADFAW